MAKTQVLDSRADQRRLRSDPGELAERLATSAYGYSRFVDASWYDGRRESGAVVEVKSCLSELQSGAAGRWRLWREQHDRLLEHDRDASAFYVFVLFDVGARPPVARMVRQAPATVGRQVGARGGWGPSGHDSRGEQHKLPIEAIMGGDP